MANLNLNILLKLIFQAFEQSIRRFAAASKMSSGIVSAEPSLEELATNRVTSLPEEETPRSVPSIDFSQNSNAQNNTVQSFHEKLPRSNSPSNRSVTQQNAGKGYKNSRE